jgi:hypothetical protein
MSPTISSCTGSLQSNFTPHLYSANAKQHADAGSLLVRVPERLLLSVHSAERDVEFSLVLKEKGQQLKSDEAGTANPFAFYSHLQ